MSLVICHLLSLICRAASEYQVQQVTSDKVTSDKLQTHHRPGRRHRSRQKLRSRNVRRVGLPGSLRRRGCPASIFRTLRPRSASKLVGKTGFRGQWRRQSALDRSDRFSNSAERQRLEALLHPRVAAMRTEKMNQFANDSLILAFIWDIPLLFETGQDHQCDAIVFVDSPFEQRLKRIQGSRGWEQTDLIRRENLQMPLDKKQEMSDYVVVNAADAAETRRQVRNVLSQILQTPKSQIK